MSNFYSTSKARANLSDLVNQVQYQNKQVAIGRHGKVEAYLISAELMDLLKDQIEDPKADFFSSKVASFFAYLAGKYKLKLIVLFGSRASGKCRSDSDIDIAYQPIDQVDYETENRLYYDLVEFFDWDKIDLINLATYDNVPLRHEIFSEGKPLFEKEKNLFIHSKIHAWSQYQDFKPLLNMKRDYLQKNIRDLKDHL